MQLAVSIGLVAIGLFLALVADTSGDMRLFGWILAGVGVFGLGARWITARLRDQRSRGGPPA